MRQGHEYIYKDWLTTRVWALWRWDVANFNARCNIHIRTIDLPVPNLFRKKKKRRSHKSMIWDWWDVSCKLGIWSAFKASHWELGSSPTFHKLTEIWVQRFVAARLVGTWYPSVGSAAKAILEPLLQSFVAYCPCVWTTSWYPCIFQSTLLQFTPPPNVFVILYLQKIWIHSFHSGWKFPQVFDSTFSEPGIFLNFKVRFLI
jgi:hypothetical protein